jgi:hypothetical protein
MRKDIDAEWALACYLDEEGSFSASLWEQRGLKVALAQEQYCVYFLYSKLQSFAEEVL